MENFVVTIFILSFLCILCKHDWKRIIFKQELVSIKNKMYSSSFQQRYHFPNWQAVRGLHDCKDIIMRKRGHRPKWSKCACFWHKSLLTSGMNSHLYSKDVCVFVVCFFLLMNNQFNHKYWRMFFYIPEYLGSRTSCWCGLSTHDTSRVNIWKHKKQELKSRRCVCCLPISYGFLDVFLLSLGVKGHVVWWWRVRPQIKKPSFKSWLPLSSCVMLRKSCNFKGSQFPHL